MVHPVFRKVIHLPGFRVANTVRRAVFAAGYYTPVLRKIGRWLVTSREDTNLTYDLQEANLLSLACTISCVTGVTKDEAFGYIKEGRDDQALQEHVARCTISSVHRARSDVQCRLGHRLGWYAIARILKPRIVVEAGVDKGLGAVSLVGALLRNRAEGVDGEYCGTDINPNAGWLLSPPYNARSKIIYGDSISSIEKVEGPIDLFINDIAHSAAYETEQYREVQRKLAKGSIVLSVTAHWSDALMRFSMENDREYLFFHEQPKDHWYPGGGIGFSFRMRDVRERLKQSMARSERRKVLCSI